MSTSAPTHVVEVNGERHRRYVVAPADVGLEPTAARCRDGRHARGQRGDDAARSSPASAGPARDLALLNAGAAIYAGGRADSLAEGVDAAREADRLGRGARARPTRYVALSRKLAAA